MSSLIICIDKYGGLALNGNIPWSFKKDMIYFRAITENHTVIMGRKTWNSLPIAPLPNRRNIVLSHSIIPDVETITDYSLVPSDAIIIGGLQIYKLLLPQVRRLYVTVVDGNFGCDTLWPELLQIVANAIPVRTIQDIERKSYQIYTLRFYDIML